MTTLTRAEAFAAMERGEDVEVHSQVIGHGRPQWVDARYSHFDYPHHEFRPKPKPQRAKVFRVRIFDDGSLISVDHIPAHQNDKKVREVLPNDMTGREMADFVLEGIAQGFGVQQLAESVKVKRDTLPETE